MTPASSLPLVLAFIVDGPLSPEAQARALHAHAQAWHALTRGGEVGATLRFEGIVRRAEPDFGTASAGAAGGGRERDLLALDYETYDPMAERGLLALAREVAGRHGLAGILALHSRGRVGVGEVSFVLEAAAAHRAETLAAVADFIDRLKQDVPIWKRAVWA
jgi:molybdopterin synthase catalytic subunit